MQLLKNLYWETNKKAHRTRKSTLPARKDDVQQKHSLISNNFNTDSSKH